MKRLMLMALLACGPSANTNSDANNDANLVGAFNIIEVVTQTTCSQVTAGDQGNDSITISLVGNTAEETISSLNGDCTGGVINGNNISWSCTINNTVQFQLDVHITGNVIKGNYTLTGSCQVVGNFTGGRQ